jgi:peptide/nickel transport system substrate-binding protein
VTIYPYSIEKATALLDKAGWQLGPDGKRRKNGELLILSISSTAGNKTRELVEQYLQQQWQQIGVTLEITNEPPRQFFGESVRKSQFPALALYALVSSSEHIPKSTFHSASIPTEANGWSGQNTYSWKNPKVDKAIELMSRELDGNKRQQLIHQIVAEYTQELPSLPLYYNADVAVTPASLKGFELSGHQFLESYRAEKWAWSKP